MNTKNKRENAIHVSLSALDLPKRKLNYVLDVRIAQQCTLDLDEHKEQERANAIRVSLSAHDLTKRKLNYALDVKNAQQRTHSI